MELDEKISTPVLSTGKNVALCLGVAALYTLCAWGSARVINASELQTELHQRADILGAMMQVDVTEQAAFYDSADGAVRFIAEMPPIAGIGRALAGGGRDLVDGNTLAQWQQRFVLIAQAYLSSQPEVFEVRLIGVADGGRALVEAVKTQAGQINVVSAQDLQTYSDRNYFMRAVTLPAGQVYFAPIDLHIVQGQIEQPPRLTLHAAMPVRDERGEVFGVLVVGMLFDPLLDDIQDALPDTQEYLVDSAGYYLLVPQSGRAFTQDYPVAPYAPALAGLILPEGISASVRRAPDGAEWFMLTCTLRPADAYGDGGLVLHAGVPMSVIAATAQANARREIALAWLLGLIVTGTLGYMLLYSRVPSPAPGRTLRILGLELPLLSTGGPSLGPVIAWALAPVALALLMAGLFPEKLLFPFLWIILPVPLASHFGGLHAGLAASVLAGVFGWTLATPETPFLNWSPGTQALAPLILATMGAVLVGLVVTFTQEKERRGAAQAVLAGRVLHTQQELFRALVESSPTGVLLVDGAGTVVLSNPQFEKDAGYERGELVGQRVERLVPSRHAAAHPDYREGYSAAPSARPMGFGRELSVQRKDGGEFPAEIALTSVPTAEGQQTMVSVVNITARKAAEAALQESELLKTAMLNSCMDAILTIDGDGQILEWNGAAERIFGYTKVQTTGKDMAALIIPEKYREAHKAGMARCLATGQGQALGKQLEMTALRADGSEFPVELLIAPISHQGVALFTGFIRDITARKAAEAALQKADLERKHYLEQMSHEMRSPLQTILGMTELLLLEPTGEEQQQLLRPIANSTHAMAAVVGDLLDLDHIEGQALTLHPDVCELWDILQECVEIGEAQASAKKFHIVNQVSPDLPRKVLVDGARVQQIVLNLVTNAVKYTERGEVVVATTFQRAGRTSGVVNVHVRDTGLGIPPEEHSRLFQRGFRASTGLRQRGTGLGLVIARGLAEAMGGSLTLLSSTTSGSEFRLSIPVSYESEALQCVPEGERRNVLVLSPSAALRHTLSDWLQAAGHRVRQADSYDGSTSEQDTTMDICLLDYRCAPRKVHESFRGRIIGMKSFWGSLDQAWDRSINMPPRKQDLLDAINKLCTPNDKAAAVTQRSSTGGDIAWNRPQRVANVLVVDDDPNARQWAVAVLGGAGCVVDVAPDGASALAKIDASRYDLVLLDQDMPDMSGLSVATRIVELEGLTMQEITPIVAFTADARLETKSQCLAAGMIDFMTKPTSASELVDMVVRRADSRTQVLVIDDSLDIQMLVRRALAADAICTVPAFDLDGARRELRRCRVSAVIVDMQIGRSNGADVIRALRDEGAWGDLPFIALSGDAGPGAEPAMRALGCSQYLNKPAKPRAIAESVRALLSGGSAQDAWHDELLGHEAAEDDLSDLIPGYLASVKKDLVLAQSALARNELDLIANAGHQMKGTGASYGFISVSKAGRALEEAAKAAQVGAVSTLLAELSQIVDEALSRNE